MSFEVETLKDDPGVFVSRGEANRNRLPGEKADAFGLYQSFDGPLRSREHS